MQGVPKRIMSYWQMFNRIPIQRRDSYLGLVDEQFHEEIAKEWYITTAVRPDYHSLIKIDVNLGFDGTSFTITCAQAVALRNELQRAIDAIPEDDRHDPEQEL
jgi:hypothetical protein